MSNELAQLIHQQKEYNRNDPLATYRPAHANAERFHASGKRRRFIFGGNRSSKSVSSVTDMIRVATGVHSTIKIPVPNSGRIIGVDMEHGIRNIIYPLIQEWSAKGSVKRTLKNPRGVPNCIIWANGSITELMSYEQSLLSFESKALDYVVFDEPPPKTIYTANMARLVDRGGFAWGAMTLIGTGDENSPFNDNWTWIFDDIFEPWDDMTEEQRAASNTDIFIFDTYDNKHLRREDIKVFEESLSETEKEARIHGKFINLLGRIHSSFDRCEPWVVPSAVIPFDWPWYESIDVNPKRGHAYIALTVSPEGQIIVCAEILARANQTVAEFAEEIKSKSIRDEHVPIWTMIDHNAYVIESTSNTSIAQELQANGIYVTPAHKGQHSVFAGINKVNTKLKLDPETRAPGLVIQKHLTNTIYQMYNFSWGKNNKPKDRYKDFPDALRYAITNNPTHSGQQVTVTSKGKRFYGKKKSNGFPIRNTEDRTILGGRVIVRTGR